MGRETKGGAEILAESALTWDSAKAITPETVGSPVLQRRLGETVAYTDSEATFAMWVKSFSKAETPPKGRWFGCGQSYPYALLEGFTIEAQRAWYEGVPSLWKALQAT